MKPGDCNRNRELRSLADALQSLGQAISELSQVDGVSTNRGVLAERHRSLLDLGRRKANLIQDDELRSDWLGELLTAGL